MADAVDPRQQDLGLGSTGIDPTGRKRGLSAVGFSGPVVLSANHRPAPRCQRTSALPEAGRRRAKRGGTDYGGRKRLGDHLGSRVTRRLDRRVVFNEVADLAVGDRFVDTGGTALTVTDQVVFLRVVGKPRRSLVGDLLLA